MDREPGFYTSLGMIGGAAAIKIIDRVFGLKRKKADDAFQLRLELKNDLHRMDEKIHQLHVELDAWKAKYYALAEENLKLRAQCEAMKVSIQALQSSALLDAPRKKAKPPVAPTNN